MSATIGTGNTAPALTAVGVVLFIWALIAYLIQLYVKLWKSTGLGVDDGAITISLLVYLLQLVFVCYAVHRGYGNPWQDVADDDREQIMVFLYASQIIYVIAVGSAKASTGLFMKRMLARDAKNIKASLAYTGLCVTWTIASALAIALRGGNKPWEILGNTNTVWTRWLAIEASGLVVDVIGAMLVASFVHELQLQVSKKIVVCAMLNCRLLLVVPVAFRLHYLVPSRVVMRGGGGDILAQAVISGAIVLTSVTCLRPFLRAFDQAASGNPSSHSGLFNYDSRAVRGTATYELGTGVSSKQASVVPRKGGKVIEEDEVALNGDGQQLSLRCNDLGPTVRVTHSSRRGDSDDDGILKEQSWSVSIGT